MLKFDRMGNIPEETLQVARAAFPKGNLYLRLREAFGTLYQDEDFRALFPATGRPALPPWRLALVTVFQFLENLTDRQAADAVRSRIDWKCALGLELSDSGFDFSVLSEFRGRLIESDAGAVLLDKMLGHFKDQGLLKSKGKQRTDSTHVLANIRTLNRSELVGETMRAALNEVAVAAPEWLTEQAPEVWYERYARRVEAYRLPKSNVGRKTYLRSVAEDGYELLEAIDSEHAPPDVQGLTQVDVLRQVWARHFERKGERVRLRDGPELSPVAEAVVSPYDPEARYANKGSVKWNGYKVHLTETCDDDSPNFIVDVRTVPAPQHDIRSTQPIHAVMVGKDLLPKEHFVDGAYTDATLFVASHATYGVRLIGPPPRDPGWQGKQGGAFSLSAFEVDWEHEQVTCPGGKVSYYWNPYRPPRGGERIQARFALSDCQPCPSRSRCTRSKKFGRFVNFQPQPQFEALEAARRYMLTEEGKKEYDRRAGIEGTISQEVRAFGARRSRYWGQAKTQLQQIATAAAINLVRYDNWLQERPKGQTRSSRFARLKSAA